MKDYNQRQYKMMNKYIEQYEKGELGIDKLINGLDALLEVLENPKKEWKKKLRSEWWVLEEMFAVALDRNETYFQLEKRDLIDEALENLKSLIKEVENDDENEENNDE